MIEADLRDQPFIGSRSKEDYPFLPAVQDGMASILSDYNPREKWREAYALDFSKHNVDWVKTYPIDAHQVSIPSRLILRGHDHHGKATELPLVATLRRLPFQDFRLDSYNPHDLAAKMAEIEAMLDYVASDLRNPVYRGSILSKLVEVLGLRSVLPWPLVARRPFHKVVRGKSDFVYYLATWTEATDGPVKNLAKDGWFKDDGHLTSFLLQILVPLLTLHVARLPLAHLHLTIEVIRYSKTDEETLSFWFGEEEFTFSTHGYRFYLEGWDQAVTGIKELRDLVTDAQEESVNSWKDSISLAFSIQPWMSPSSRLNPLFDVLTRPRVNHKPLSLEDRYLQSAKSLRSLLNFRPDDLEDYSIHRVVDSIVRGFF